MALEKNQRSQIKTILEKLKKELFSGIKEADKNSKPVQLDQQAVGRVSRIDAIQQQQMQLAALSRLKQKSMMVEKALDNIHSEDFGICKACEESIEFKRLKARPESPICLTCAKK